MRLKPRRRSAQCVPTEPVEQEEAIPTAMEMALREAMEKSTPEPAEQGTETKAREATSDPELDEILARTLEHKVKTAS